MPLGGKGYSIGKKVPQVGGNSPTNFSPPNKVNQVSGNVSSGTVAPTNRNMGGNYVPNKKNIHTK